MRGRMMTGRGRTTSEPHTHTHTLVVCERVFWFISPLFMITFDA